MTRQFDIEQAMGATGLVSVRLKRIGEECYPGIPWRRWSKEMFNDIHKKAELEILKKWL